MRLHKHYPLFEAQMKGWNEWTHTFHSDTNISVFARPLSKNKKNAVPRHRYARCRAIMSKNDSLSGTIPQLRKARQRESAVPKHRYWRYQIVDIIT
ncbi:MAG: hypothetical protein MJZ20_03280 [Bacteroidaceae bacterium]|nr:hypothetical protein [Bacteroidaceae bacterium]